MDILAGCTFGALITLAYCAVINPAAFLIMALILPAEIFLVIKENKETVEARMERLPHEQRREYGNRVFYLADYAGELRLYPEMKQKCRADYEASNEQIREVNRKYGRRLFLLGALRDALLNCTVLEGIVWTVLLYQMLVLQTLSGARLITSRSCIRRLRINMQHIIEGGRMAAENAEYIYRIRELLRLEQAMDCSGRETVPEGSSGLAVEHVNFSYLPGRPVLRDVNLYRKQNMIIMDEPSSALDPLAEYRLNQELNQIAKDKTVIFISHRLSTTRDADCIYMMEEGRIVESGTHEQLLQENGKYAAMWRIQAGLYA